MALVKSTLYIGEKPTVNAVAEAEAAAKRTVTFDEDCPPTTESELAMLDALIAKRKADREKRNVSLRVSARMLDQTRERVGKGYTGFLSRLLEAAMEEPELVKKCL